MTVDVTKDHFVQTIQEAEGPLLLDFWAPWCGPCRKIAPLLEEIEAEDRTLTIGKVNIEEERELAGVFRVLSIPTLILIRQGRIVGRMTGAKSKQTILELLEQEPEKDAEPMFSTECE